MTANMGSMKAELKSAIKDLKINGEETVAYQGKTEARVQGERASEDMTLEVAHEQEVPLEDAEFMPVGEPRKRRRDQRRNLAVVRRQKKQKQNLDARRRGKQRNLVTASRATVAWRKINVFRKILTNRFCELRKEVTAARIKITRSSGHRRKRQNKDNAERETRRDERSRMDAGEAQNGTTT
jgi:hypothetical protein